MPIIHHSGVLLFRKVPVVQRSILVPACVLLTSQVSKVVVFLASGDAAMVTGSSYAVDGGWAVKA